MGLCIYAWTSIHRYEHAYKHEQLSSTILDSLAIRTLFNNWPGHFQSYCTNKIIVHPNIAKMIFMCHILARYMFIILCYVEYRTSNHWGGTFRPLSNISGIGCFICDQAVYIPVSSTFPFAMNLDILCQINPSFWWKKAPLFNPFILIS